MTLKSQSNSCAKFLTIQRGIISSFSAYRILLGVSHLVIGLFKTKLQYSQKSGCQTGVKIIRSYFNRSSLTPALRIIFEITYFISSIGETKRRSLSFSLQKLCRPSHAPRLTANSATSSQRFFAYDKISLNSKIARRGSQEAGPCRLCPCLGKSKLSTCRPCSQTTEAKSSASSLLPPCP